MMFRKIYQRKCKPVHIKDLVVELKDHYQRSEPKGFDRLGPFEFALVIVLILYVWLMNEKENYEKL